MTAATSANDAAIVVEGVHKRYGDRAVVDGVSFAVRPGEVVALLGPNGAGKTTTVEMIEGYRAADEGRVQVLGADPRTGGRTLRARVGLMLQDGGFDIRARPRETLRQYAAFHADPRSPDQLLALLGLTDVARTPYRRLSGGERQRLGLAVALVGRPEVAILDEPTAGMDPEARAATRMILHELRGDGVAILLTSHDLTDVERLADRIVLLADGRVRASGTVAELTAGLRPRLRVVLDRPLTGPRTGRARRGRSGRASPPWSRADMRSRTVRRPRSWSPRSRRGAPRPDASCWSRGRVGGTLEEAYLELVGGERRRRRPRPRRGDRHEPSCELPASHDRPGRGRAAAHRAPGREPPRHGRHPGRAAPLLQRDHDHPGTRERRPRGRGPARHAGPGDHRDRARQPRDRDGVRAQLWRAQATRRLAARSRRPGRRPRSRPSSWSSSCSACVLIGIAAAILGWRPDGPVSIPALLAAIVLGTATFAGFGLAMAGSLRAEAVLVLANVLFLVVMVVGGVLVPVAQLPGTVGDDRRPWLPPAALTAVLGAALGSGRSTGPLGSSSWSGRRSPSPWPCGRSTGIDPPARTTPPRTGSATRTPQRWNERHHGDAIGFRVRPPGRAAMQRRSVDQRGLVERAQRGDHDAFAVLAGAAVARLDAAARLILRDPRARARRGPGGAHPSLARPAGVARRRPVRCLAPPADRQRLPRPGAPTSAPRRSRSR